jgi:SAM-dependent methyltransferase
MATAAAVDAYDVLAPAYETIVAGYDYDRWLAAIEEIALRDGLSGRRVLDVACGTGASFAPLLDRGYEVVGSDLSPGMLARARERVAGRGVDLHQADMRSLPDLGRFDLVLCLDDSLNHLLEADDVDLAFAGMARSLAAGGLVVFDVNTLGALRAAFSAAWSWEGDDGVVRWRGLGSPNLAPEGTTAASVSAENRGSAPHTTLIRERHHPVDRLLRQLVAARLEPLAVLGQRRGIRLSPDADELRDDKVLFFARSRG